MEYRTADTSNFYPRPPRGGRRGRVSGSIWAATFLSTPSARRATRFLRTTPTTPAISIHALREEGDTTSEGRSTPGEQFLSTPSARRATLTLRAQIAKLKKYFYPRPPRGGRPGAIFSEQLVKGFLSTPSARRATIRKPNERVQKIYFYPRPPRGGRRAVGGVIVRRSRISIHALREEGDVAVLTAKIGSDYFYPRPPRGGRQFRSVRLQERSQFLSTPSARRATRSCAEAHGADGNFYPRPPRGGRPIQRSAFRHLRNFYPRPPRGGRPGRRSTRLPSFRHFYPRPPRGGRLFTSERPLLRMPNFYPRPPRGGRRIDKNNRKLSRISIHALREEGDQL